MNEGLFAAPADIEIVRRVKPEIKKDADGYKSVATAHSGDFREFLPGELVRAVGTGESIADIIEEVKTSGICLAFVAARFNSRREW